MLIYAAADLHAQPQRIRVIQRYVDAHRPDILLLAGDMSTRRQPDVLLDKLNRLNLPVLLIRGNSDSRNLASRIQPFPHLQLLHLSMSRFGDVEIVGIGGTLPLPFHSRLGFRETDSL